MRSCTVDLIIVFTYYQSVSGLIKQYWHKGNFQFNCWKYLLIFNIHGINTLEK